MVIKENPYPPYLPGEGTLALYDPLTDSNSSWQIGSPWQIGSDGMGGSCQFSNGDLHVSETTQGWWFSCAELNRDFNNFAFEVQMHIIQEMNIVQYGCAGMAFRSDLKNSVKTYLFNVCSDGHYHLYMYVDFTQPAKILTYGSSSITKFNQTSIIAVVATGNTIMLYINKQKIDTVQDNTYSHGNIGLIADSYGATAAYTYAKVWML
jgi:hypothetical protein